MATLLLLPIVTKLGFSCIKHLIGPCTLQAVVPACGSVDGGTVIRITGEGFQTGVVPRIKFTYYGVDPRAPSAIGGESKQVKKSLYADGKVCGTVWETFWCVGGRYL